MVSIPSPVQNYLMLWGISLGSSIGLMFVAALIYIITGESSGVTELFILMFNATATSFILLTMIPVGVFILIFGVSFNALAPLIAPIFAALWNFGAELIVAIINAVPLIDLDIAFAPIQFVSVISAFPVDYIQLTVPTINITEAIDGVTSLLTTLQAFMIDAATGGNGSINASQVMAKLWS